MKTVSREEAVSIILAKIASTGRKAYEDDAFRLLNSVYALPNGTYWREAVEQLKV